MLSREREREEEREREKIKDGQNSIMKSDREKR